MPAIPVKVPPIRGLTSSQSLASGLTLQANMGLPRKLMKNMPIQKSEAQLPTSMRQSRITDRADADLLSQQFSQRDRKSKFKVSRQALKTMTQVAARDPQRSTHDAESE
jgi:hypothetical protein